MFSGSTKILHLYNGNLYSELIINYVNDCLKFRFASFHVMAAFSEHEVELHTISQFFFSFLFFLIFFHLVYINLFLLGKRILSVEAHRRECLIAIDLYICCIVLIKKVF